MAVHARTNTRVSRGLSEESLIRTRRYRARDGWSGGHDEGSSAALLWRGGGGKNLSSDYFHSRNKLRASGLSSVPENVLRG